MKLQLSKGTRTIQTLYVNCADDDPSKHIFGECYIAALTADADVQIEALEAKVAAPQVELNDSLRKEVDSYIKDIIDEYDEAKQQLKKYEAKVEVLEERLTDAQDKSQDLDAMRNQRDYFSACYRELAYRIHNILDSDTLHAEVKDLKERIKYNREHAPERFQALFQRKNTDDIAF